MRISHSVAACVLLLLAAAPSRAGDETPKAPRPLPVDRTQKLIEELAVYTVEGRVRIRKGTEITVLRNCMIKAAGSSPAVIEVEGGFDCIGVFGREVIFENVTVEPCAKFEEIHTDMVIFRGTGGVKTAKDVSADGYLFHENTDMVGNAALDVTFQSGSVKLSSACFNSPVRIRTVCPPGKEHDQVRVFVRGCHQEPTHKCSPHGGRVGLVGGMEVDGGDDVTIQLSRIGGRLCSVRNWGQRMIFDGNKINSTKLAFGHRAAGQFQGVQCAKLDVYSTEIAVDAPPSESLKDTFVMDRCWFKGVVDPKVIFSTLIKDGSDDPKNNGTRVTLPKVDARPHELAGDQDR